MLKDFFLFIIINLPGKTGIKLRNLVYKRIFLSFGKNVIIMPGVTFIGKKFITIGNNVKIDSNCLIETGEVTKGKIIQKNKSKDCKIFIGNHVHICRNSELIGYGSLKINDNSVLSSGCKLYSLTNMPNNPQNNKEKISLMPYKNSIFLRGPIELKKNVWLGLNVILMPGVRIGEDSFISSNSIVKYDVKKNSHLTIIRKEKSKFRFER